jgi:alkanesulfonate monooxygenase SsuD/methylene tetrahydromethanopterin reductase-like flavin-dependent oxidoreductase (luciferase family)
MKFGILLPVEGNVTEGMVNPKLALKVARRAEDLGYDSVWAGERMLLSKRLDPISLLGAVASVTEQVSLGAAVLIAPLKHPIILADQLASLDNISNGRLIAGFGVGADRIKLEYESVGVSFTDRGSRLDECISIMKQAWKGKIDFEGKHFRLSNLEMALKPKQKDGPPIFLGGAKKVSLKRVARYADGWMPIDLSPSEYQTAYDKIKSYQDTQRTIERDLYITLNIRENKEIAKEESHRFLDTYYNVKFPSIDKMAFFGTVEDALRRFEEYSSVGVERAIVRFASFGDQVNQVESFSEKVKSRF